MEHFTDDDFVAILRLVRNISGSAKFLFFVPNSESRAYLMMRYNLQSRGRWPFGKNTSAAIMPRYAGGRGLRSFPSAMLPGNFKLSFRFNLFGR
jgi:hypothetical protein